MHIPHTDYASADQLMTGRRRNKARIAHQTNLIRVGGEIEVQYCKHSVVRLYSDGRVELCMESRWIGMLPRIQACLRGWRIEQDRGYWIIRRNGERHLVQLRTTIHPDLSVSGADTRDPQEVLQEHKRAIQQRAKFHKLTTDGNLSVGDIVRIEPVHEYYRKLIPAGLELLRVTGLWRNGNAKTKITIEDLQGQPRSAERLTVLTANPKRSWRYYNWRFKFIPDPFLTAVHKRRS